MRKTLLITLFLVGLAIPGYSQLFSVGVKAGIPLNESPIGTYPGVSSETQRWLVGPTAEIHLPFRLSFEVDALYRQQKFLYTDRYSGVSYNPETFNDWQFPFLAKYDLRGGLFRPFVDAGLSYRHISGFVQNPNTAGFTIGGGVSLKLLFLRISPEFRYTRWAGKPTLDNFATTPQNQGDFMVGFTF